MTRNPTPLVLLRRPAAWLAFTLLPVTAHAHGGQYRGPGSVVPQQPLLTSTDSSGQKGNGGTAGGTGSGATSGPTVGGQPASPGGPGSGRAAPTTGGGSLGAPLDEDLGRWEFWWEFGKDPYLRLREAIYGGRRTAADDLLLARQLGARTRLARRPDPRELATVAEALHAALVKSRDRDNQSAGIIALAKIGLDGNGWSLRSTFVPYLASGDQELRETAALALGIAGHVTPDVINLLAELVADGPAARRVSGDVAVNERTRAFAAFALGLLLQRTEDPGLVHSITAALLPVLAHPERHSRDLKVAAIEALSLLPGRWTGGAAAAMRTGIVRGLGRYYDLDLGPGEQLLQAHAPLAIARLLGPDDPQTQAWKARFAAELDRTLATAGAPDPKAKSNLHVGQSLVLALGELAQPWLAGGADAAIGDLLLRTYRGSRDEQTRSFALLAIARLGGDEARATLLRELQRAGKAIEQPWCAMALGLLQARHATRVAPGPAPEAHADVRLALQRTFTEARNPNARAAIAIALGLCGDPAAAEVLRRAVPEHRMQEDLAGYLALALGMLGDVRALGEVRQLFADSTQRPFLRMQSVRALGLLGDTERIDDLCQQLRGGDRSLVRLAATATALGQIGDRRALEPLLQIVQDEHCIPLGRAFATVALGTIGDKDPMPWNSVYASQVNYRAATPTLTNGASGLLDIL